MKSFEFYWVYLTSFDSETSIVLREDAQGPVSLSLKLPGRDVFKVEAESPMLALHIMYNIMKQEEEEVPWYT